MPVSEGRSEPLSLKVSLGGEAGVSWELGLPLLGGPALETLLPSGDPAGVAGVFRLFGGEGWLAGIAEVSTAGGLAGAAKSAYGDLIGAVRGWHLARIWNYVPAINETGPEGLENYKIFCRERSQAFEAALGAGFESTLPAASAVGCERETLRILFLATRIRPVHFENPRQTPAYAYPPEYGPRPPSFARATRVSLEGKTYTFISGTAAIVGSRSLACGDTEEQLRHTLENLRLISTAAGLGTDMGGGSGAARQFKVYLRQPGDLGLVEKTLNAELLAPGDVVSYVKADICRAELTVEIEGWVAG